MMIRRRAALVAASMLVWAASAAAQAEYIYRAPIKGAAPVQTASPASDPCTTGTPAVGTRCADGSVYAGTAPDGGKLITMAADLGVYSFNNGATTSEYIGATNMDDGRVNAAILLANSGASAPYKAAKACDDATTHGKTDWYLPAIMEIRTVVYARAAIGGIGFVNYSSSTEYTSGTTPTTKAYVFAADGIAAPLDKWASASVRCVRRG